MPVSALQPLATSVPARTGSAGPVAATDDNRGSAGSRDLGEWRDSAAPSAARWRALAGALGMALCIVDVHR